MIRRGRAQLEEVRKETESIRKVSVRILKLRYRAVQGAGLGLAHLSAKAPNDEEAHLRKTMLQRAQGRFLKFLIKHRIIRSFFVAPKYLGEK